MAGFRKFKEKYFFEDALGRGSVYQRLASAGQSPKTLLIGCSDSRVDPAILTGAEPGELFVVRNVANLVPPCEPAGQGLHGTSSALEFAVVNLKVENIIVLGHRQCGGIRALMQGVTDKADGFIGRWMRIAEDARAKVLKEHPKADEETQWRLAEMEGIRVSLRNLKTFPFIKERVESGQLNLVGIYFDLEQGQLFECNDINEPFRKLEI